MNARKKSGVVSIDYLKLYGFLMTLKDRNIFVQAELIEIMEKM
jgi:hypothetical protein